MLLDSAVLRHLLVATPDDDVALATLERPVAGVGSVAET